MFFSLTIIVSHLLAYLYYKLKVLKLDMLPFKLILKIYHEF